MRFYWVSCCSVHITSSILSWWLAKHDLQVEGTRLILTKPIPKNWNFSRGALILQYYFTRCTKVYPYNSQIIDDRGNIIDDQGNVRDNHRWSAVIDITFTLASVNIIKDQGWVKQYYRCSGMILAKLRHPTGDSKNTSNRL